jgi:hypothetical protein
MRDSKEAQARPDKLALATSRSNETQQNQARGNCRSRGGK